MNSLLVSLYTWCFHEGMTGISTKSRAMTGLYYFASGCHNVILRRLTLQSSTQGQRQWELCYVGAADVLIVIWCPSAHPHFLSCRETLGRSQWSCGLRHELHSPAQTLGLWVRISLKAWMFVCIYSVFVLSCVDVAALQRAESPSKESYRLCKRSRNWISDKGPTKGCRAIDKIDR
jgi:hypothetical protein